jgi:hypothetical protein
MQLRHTVIVLSTLLHCVHTYATFNAYTVDTSDLPYCGLDIGRRLELTLFCTITIKNITICHASQIVYLTIEHELCPDKLLVSTNPNIGREETGIYRMIYLRTFEEADDLIRYSESCTKFRLRRRYSIR